MQKDWGYSALIEYAGKRILFDTGNNPEILGQNAKAKGADLSKLDFVVMSHRHGDHMGGLPYLLQVNPAVKIYAPKENFGVYGADLPGSFYRKDPSLPREQRYYDGDPPEIMRFGSAWPAANFQLVDKNTEIAPNIHLITLVPTNREHSSCGNYRHGPPRHLQGRVRCSGSLHGRARIYGTKNSFRRSLSVRGAGNSGVCAVDGCRQSLAINTPDGIVIVVGCSHPGLDKNQSGTVSRTRIPVIRNMWSFRLSRC